MFFFSYKSLYHIADKHVTIYFFELLRTDILSLVVLFICYAVGFITLLTFSDQMWVKNLEIPVIVLYFQTICYILVSADNLIVMFLSYELILLPAIYIVYKASYSEKSIQALIYFFIWTQVGSLFILIGISYIFFTKKSLYYLDLSNSYFSNYEVAVLYFIFLFGFGVKVPVWPLHYWLLKVHVEAPTPFSIFLSGFLVKIGVFCFVSSTYFFNESHISWTGMIFCIIGMVDSALKMWGQDDLKKLVATATVLDMNFTYFLFLFNDNGFIWTGIMSMIGHALLSTLMFFLVECVYRRTGTRSISKICGLSNFYPNLVLAIWSMLILFLGFPGSLKFFAEFRALSYFSNISSYIVIIGLGFMIVLGGICIARAWLLVAYGQSVSQRELTEKYILIDLTKYEIFIILLVFILSFIACFVSIYATGFFFL